MDVGKGRERVCKEEPVIEPVDNRGREDVLVCKEERSQLSSGKRESVCMGKEELVVDRRAKESEKAECMCMCEDSREAEDKTAKNS
jgi:hypothetical protein